MIWYVCSKVFLKYLKTDGATLVEVSRTKNFPGKMVISGDWQLIWSGLSAGSELSSVQVLSHVWLFVTPCTVACQASLSITNSQSLLKFMSIESVMPSENLILCPSLLAFNLSQHQGLFQVVSSSHQAAKVFELQLQHQSFQWIFRTDFL